MEPNEPHSYPKAQNDEGLANTPSKVLGTVAVALASIPALPQAFEQYPYGAAVVVFLAIYGGRCWKYWVRMKYRRR